MVLPTETGYAPRFVEGVEGRSPFATAFACAVVHEARGHGGTFCTLMPLAATSWPVFKESVREGTSSLFATAFACAVVHEARGH
jgi:hypothetical protein